MQCLRILDAPLHKLHAQLEGRYSAVAGEGGRHANDHQHDDNTRVYRIRCWNQQQQHLTSETPLSPLPRESLPAPLTLLLLLRSTEPPPARGVFGSPTSLHASWKQDESNSRKTRPVRQHVVDSLV